MSHRRSLLGRYPPSEPCECIICLSYCKRPGWWTVEEAARAIKGGYAGRMMLEMSPDRSFGVLSPAFKGCEVAFATNFYSSNSCTFFIDKRCELFGTGYQQLECRFCHHDRAGLGPRCHADIEREWNSSTGRALVVTWSDLTNFWQNLVGSISRISLI